MENIRFICNVIVIQFNNHVELYPPSISLKNIIQREASEIFEKQSLRCAMQITESPNERKT